jgi:hypothetical protein
VKKRERRRREGVKPIAVALKCLSDIGIEFGLHRFEISKRGWRAHIFNELYIKVTGSSTVYAIKLFVCKKKKSK